ncbi:related to HCM1 - transcription factor [Cephalotrichum gorgonifer]|uniref:Related to HCM1 - transcription factor n=1 Tax=Cephalotrichum gorgonifer TaxID=2041049 RepID=A0AAE8N005_9PEZI|nr:related to HCM1 - transcription factor [Cephalotrichum gorgonifer]
MPNPTRYLMPNQGTQGIGVFEDHWNPMSMIPQIPLVPASVAAPAPAAAPAASRKRRALQAASNNVMLNPPNHPGRVAMSPQKLAPASAPEPLAALKPSQGNKLQPMPMAPPASLHDNNNATDSLRKKPFLTRFKTNAQKPSVHNMAQFGKENVSPNYFSGNGATNIAYSFSHTQQPPPPPQKTAGKRALMDAANIKDSRPAKKAKTTTEEPQGVEIPPHDSFPPIIDNGSKPGHSYATLIGMAILRSPNRRLTLSQIYKWISDTYSFYAPDDAGWQNSIRHNLSLHKAFYKMERPKDDPGKGNYWCIQPGVEQQFLKDKPTRRYNNSTTASETVIQARPGTATKEKEKNKTPSIQPQPQSQLPQPQPQPQARPQGQPSTEPTLPPSQPVSDAYANQTSLPPLHTSQATIAPPPGPSSDGTILISDGFTPDDNEKAAGGELPQDAPYSPLPPAMHSSPPVPRSVRPTGGTSPPPLGRNPTPSAFRSQTRGFLSMDDSGYISSLESSVMRQKPTGLLTSETDRPRIKRGRAEEEILRLRASSPHSPSKGRSRSGYAPVSSSPLRREPGMLFPLTPAVKLKSPVRAPPSVSPNTSLQIHRNNIFDMLQSPIRKMAPDAFDSNAFQYSPAFTFENMGFGGDMDPSNTAQVTGGFDWDLLHDDIGDNEFSNLVGFPDSSPTKRSGATSRMDRSHSTSALHGSMSSMFTNKLSSNNVPMLRVFEDNTADALDTPTRAPRNASRAEAFLRSPGPLLQTPSKVPNTSAPAEEDWTGLNSLDSTLFETDSGGFDGESGSFDMLQSFQRIGSGASGSGPESNQSGTSKPNLSRHYSTGF